MQVGACIVNKDNKIVGIGYNGFPRHVSDDDSDMNWSAESDLPRHSKLSYGKKVLLLSLTWIKSYIIAYLTN